MRFVFRPLCKFDARIIARLGAQISQPLLPLFQLMDAVPKSEWKPVTVAVAPSTVTINFEDPNEATLDCRVR